jgi:hypothetical protein
MSYFDILKVNLLSQQNIDYLMKKVFSTFKISPNSSNKCAKIIKDLLTSYLPSISNPPTDEHSMISGLEHLNALCLQHFEEYLKQNYPGRDLRHSPVTDRTQSPVLSNDSLPPFDKRVTYIDSDLPPTEPSQQSYVPIASSVEPSQQYYPPMQIINRSQVSQLLRENNMLKSNNLSTEFLKLLADPEVLTMFMTMVNKINSHKPVEDKKSFTKIIDAKQLQELLNPPVVQSKTRQIKKAQKKPILPPPPESSESESSSSESESESDSESDSDEETNDEIFVPSTKKYDPRNINSKNLEEIHSRIKHLTHLRSIYLKKDDRETVKKINEEKAELLKIIIALKDQATAQIAASQAKIDCVNKSDDDADSEIMDLRIDPMDNKDNLLHINYLLPPRKIKEISLHEYYLPHNPNNITRFNNRFLTKLNGGVSRIKVPEGFYEIDVLLSYLGSSVGYLEFMINKDKTISIKSKCDIPFDIMIDDYTFMDILGFTESAQTYQGSTIYHGTKPYDITVPKTVIFSTNGTDQGPFTLETDQRIHLKEPLVIRKHNRGVSIKNLQIVLKTPSGRIYDFIMPLQMCFHISYAPVI